MFLMEFYTYLALKNQRIMDLDVGIHRFSGPVEEPIEKLEIINEPSFCYQIVNCLKHVKFFFSTLLLVFLAINPIAFIIIATILWKRYYDSILPQSMIAWAIIHIIAYCKIFQLKLSNKLNTIFTESNIQTVLNLCIIAWFIVFILMVITLSFNRPADFNVILLYYIIVNLIISFVMFGIPCIIIIGPIICESLSVVD